MTQRVAEIGLDEWDETVFRATVTDNLARGRFRLVIVVDEITDELKRTVRYVNRHTGAELQFVALELRYVADQGVEIILPTVYDEETVQAKTPSSAKQR